MDGPNIIASIKSQIASGELEQALDQLVALLESDERYAELAQVACVNQAEYRQLRAQVLKDTISPDEARTATNRITDNALQVIRRYEAGKFTFSEGGKPVKTWVPYAIGGVVALLLALLGWYFFRTKPANLNCPDYGKTAELQVLILPFKGSNANSGLQPEFEILDGLNDLIENTPRLNAIAAVKQKHDIESNYPNYAEAEQIAQNCGAQMIVWGRLSQTESGYKINVQYRIVDASGVKVAGDTSLSNLLKMKEQGQLYRDVSSVTKLLYIVLANRAKIPIAANLFPELPPPNAAATDTSGTAAIRDTSASLLYAMNLTNSGQTDKAIVMYDRILEAYPDNKEARLRRGALLYEKKDFSGAARDLDAAEPDLQKADPSLLKVRVDANLKSGQPDKAERDLRSLKSKGRDGAWIDKKTRETKDSTVALTNRLEKLEQNLDAKPSTQGQVDAAKLSLAVGDTKNALRHAAATMRRDPNNKEAVSVTVQAHLDNGDTAKAEAALRNAAERGVNVKAIVREKPFIRQLLPDEAAKVPKRGG